MILDKLLQFSDAQAVTATAASTSSIDLASARNIGIGQNLYLVVCCIVAMTDTGSDSTVAVSLEGDSTTTFTPDTTIAVGTFAALSAAGTKKVLRIPPDFMNLRYAQVKYTVSGGDLTTGSFDAFICNDVDLQSYFPRGYTVS